MDLKEAISHSRGIQNNSCDQQCATNHAQLADWLEELEKLRTVAFHANRLYEICADLPIEFPAADRFVWTMGDLQDALKAAGIIKTPEDQEQLKKMFCFNEDGVAEYIVAENIDQAIVCYENITGGAMKQTFEEEQKGDNTLTWEAFVAGYVKEESPDKEFTMHWDKDRVETKTIREFLREVQEVPSYFACQDY